LHETAPASRRKRAFPSQNFVHVFAQRCHCWRAFHSHTRANFDPPVSLFILLLTVRWNEHSRSFALSLESMTSSHSTPSIGIPLSIIARLLSCLVLSVFVADAAPVPAPADLDAGWMTPPKTARLRAYWWWLNGNVTKASITHELEEMKAKGFGGALIMDAGGADLIGNDPVPAGPTFSTPAWRGLLMHALREAERLDLEISLNIQSG